MSILNYSKYFESIPSYEILLTIFYIGKRVDWNFWTDFVFFLESQNQENLLALSNNILQRHSIKYIHC